MKKYTTTLQAIDPKDGNLKTWGGPRIDAISWEHASQLLQDNGLGYCEVDGRLIAEVDQETGERTDYDHHDN